MAELSGISWTDHSFCPWHGCTQVSLGKHGACVACYARGLDEFRFHRVVYGQGQARVRSADSTWAMPRTWNRKAAAAGERRFVFCNHLGDVFDNQVPPQWRRDLFDLIRATPNLVWLLLTKRPQNIERLYVEAHEDLPLASGGPDWPQNACAGATVVNQPEANRDLIHLATAASQLGIPLIFASCEPLMGGIDFCNLTTTDGHHFDAFSGVESGPAGATDWWQPLGWVITGGETNQGKFRARPTNPNWERSIRDQCAAAGVPYHRKQAGEWAEQPHIVDASQGDLHHRFEDGTWMMRVGKKAAGRLLDGVLHDARPEVAR